MLLGAIEACLTGHEHVLALERVEPDADAEAPSAAVEGEPSAPVPRVPAVVPKMEAPSQLLTPRETLGSLLHVHYFVQSFRDIFMPDPKDGCRLSRQEPL